MKEGMRCPWCMRVVVDGVRGRDRPFGMIAVDAEFDPVAEAKGGRRDGVVVRGSGAWSVADEAGVGDGVRVGDGVGGNRVGNWVGILSLGALHLALLVVADYCSPYYHRTLLTLLFMAGVLLLASLLLTGALVTVDRWINTIRQRRRLSRATSALLMWSVGLCVGIAGDRWWLKWLGSALLARGKVPFVEGLVRTYGENDVEVSLGAAAILVAAQVGENMLWGVTVFFAVPTLVVDCVTFGIVDRLI